MIVTPKNELGGGFTPKPWGNDPMWLTHIFSKGLFNHQLARLQICPLYSFGNNPPQMVPRDLNVGFQGLAAWFRAKSTTTNWVFPKIGVPPKSSILIGFSIIINHPFWGPTPICGNTQLVKVKGGSHGVSFQDFSDRFGCDFAMRYLFQVERCHEGWLGQIHASVYEVTLKKKGHVWVGVFDKYSLGGGFKYFLFSSLPGEMIQFD